MRQKSQDANKLIKQLHSEAKKYRPRQQFCLIVPKRLELGTRLAPRI